jgi:hypothetical protein
MIALSTTDALRAPRLDRRRRGCHSRISQEARARPTKKHLTVSCRLHRNRLSASVRPLVWASNQPVLVLTWIAAYLVCGYVAELLSQFGMSGFVPSRNS